MRFILTIISLLLVFQPVSWSFAAPMYTHGQMDHESTMPTMLMATSLSEHCNYGGKYGVSEPLSASDTSELSDPQDGHLTMSCFVTGSAVAVSIAAVTETVEPTVLATVFQPVKSSFLSRTESPEIRPPHSTRS